MFCPQCKSEYVAGVAECADCKIPLVSAIQPDFVRVLATNNFEDIALIREILDEEGIEYSLETENSSDVAPQEPATVLNVRKGEESRVREALSVSDIKFPSDFVRVLSTYSQGDIAVVKPILDDAEIEYYFQGENFAALDPLIQPAILFVRRGQLEKAKEVLKDTHISYLGVSTSEDTGQ